MAFDDLAERAGAIKKLLGRIRYSIDETKMLASHVDELADTVQKLAKEAATLEERVCVLTEAEEAGKRGGKTKKKARRKR